jgi:hypothetical protein
MSSFAQGKGASMHRRRWLAVLALGGLSFATCGCYSFEAERQTKAWRRDLNTDLAVGASSQEIEAYFARRKTLLLWNRAAKRYEGHVDVDQWSGASIIIFVDDQRRFLRAEVQSSYTGI